MTNPAEVKMFSKKEALKYGWRATMQNFWFLIVLLFAVILVTSFLPGLIQSQLAGRAAVLGFFVDVAGWALQIIANMGLIYIALKIYNNQKPSFRDLFAPIHYFFKYLLGSVLYSLIVFGGLLLLVVPGIIWAIKFQFFSYFIIDKGMGPVEALRASSKLTMGVKWHLFFVLLFLALINIIGAILVLGLLITVPVTILTIAYLYKKLLPQMDINPALKPEPSK